MSAIDPFPADEEDIPIDIKIEPAPISAVDFVRAIDEADLITQLKDLRSQYEALIIPDPNEAERHELALKMQAIKERLRLL